MECGSRSPSAFFVVSASGREGAWTRQGVGGLAKLAPGHNLSLPVWHLCGQVSVSDEQVMLAQIQQPRPGGRDPNFPGAAAALATGATRVSESSCEGVSQMAVASSISCMLDHVITP